MKLSDIIVTDAITPDIHGATRDKAIEELVTALASAGAILKRNVKEIVKAVLARENQGTTGMGRGISLPHAKTKSVRTVVGAIGRSTKGIDFKAMDSMPVYIVILLLSNPDNPDQHLQAMETIYKHMQNDMFRRFLRQCETANDIVEWIDEVDRGTG